MHREAPSLTLAWGPRRAWRAAAFRFAQCLATAFDQPLSRELKSVRSSGSVISLAAAGEASVAHLIYISDILRPAGFPGEDLGRIDTDRSPLVGLGPTVTRQSVNWVFDSVRAAE
jgi:hypothetical protein